MMGWFRPIATVRGGDGIIKRISVRLEMAKKDKEQSKRFIEKARELEADESGQKFEQVIEKIIPSKKRKRENKLILKLDRSEEG